MDIYGNLSTYSGIVYPFTECSSYIFYCNSLNTYEWIVNDKKASCKIISFKRNAESEVSKEKLEGVGPKHL
jgi:hypothetical protein